jgi:hypothetical protein
LNPALRFPHPDLLKADAAGEEDMAAVRLEPIFAAVPEQAPRYADPVDRIAALARLLDSSIPVPGTGRTVGLDAVLGLLPGIGDALSATLSAYIVWEARRLGVPKRQIARMVGNVALDTAVGAVPLVGDLFDMVFKANRRNVRIVIDHLEKTGRLPPRPPEGSARSSRR